MHTVGVRVGDRQRSILWQLTLQCYRRLEYVGSTQTGTDLLDDLRRRGSAQRGDRGNVRVKIRIGDHILLLHDAVIALRGEGICQNEAIVEGPESSAQNRLWFSATPESPSDSRAGGDIPPVVDVGLGFVAQAQTHGHVGA